MLQIYKDEFESVFKLMENSFPSVERRSVEDQKNLFDEKAYNVIGKKDKHGNVVAFIANWEFNNFIFIEHFAVDKSMRGNGLGSLMLKDYLKECDKPIFLEVEEPDTEIAIRRIEFYKRLGFKLNEFDYVQPPLQKQNPILPLKVMSYPRHVDKMEFINFKNIVYDKVYKAHEIK